MEEKSKMVLGRKNYNFIILGCLVVLLGFILMSGGGSEDPNVFNEEELFNNLKEDFVKTHEHFKEYFKQFKDDFIINDVKKRLEKTDEYVKHQVLDHKFKYRQEEKITYKETEIELKGKPFEVLTHLARHRDQIVSKEQLLDAIWEEPELVTPNVIEVAINQIRQKMDKPLNIATIETIRRRGYRFCYPPKVEKTV